VRRMSQHLALPFYRLSAAGAQLDRMDGSR
jgi:hypothetical protein